VKVCIPATIYPLYEGDFSGIFVHGLAKSLVRRGVEVHAVVPHAAGAKREETMNGVHIQRFRYAYPESFQTLAYHPGIPENIKKPFNKLEVLPFIVSMARRMLQVVKEARVDVLNPHWALPSALVAAWTRRIHKRPVVTTLYGVEMFLVAGKYSVFRPLLRSAIANSDRVIAISDATASAARNVVGEKEVEVIPDGVDTEVFSPENSGDEIRRRHGLGGDKVVLTCGRLVKRKGFEYLLRALPAVMDRVPEARVIVVGEGPEETRLRSLASSLGIADRVLFPGVVSDTDLPLYYAACDAFVLPSIVDSRGDTEGSGTTLVEAMASGKPVVGSNVGGIPYALRDGEVGFLVQEKNPAQLADRIVTLLSDQTLSGKLGREGRRVATQRFAWQSIAERYLSVFESVTEAKRRQQL